MARKLLIASLLPLALLLSALALGAWSNISGMGNAWLGIISSAENAMLGMGLGGRLPDEWPRAMMWTLAASLLWGAVLAACVPPEPPPKPQHRPYVRPAPSKPPIRR